MECLICGSKKPKLIQSTRIQSFQEASEQRGDGLSEKLPAGEVQFTCHKNCISTYCSKHHIERCLRKRKMETSDAPSPKKLRGNCTFNFLRDCLFCGQECTVSRPHKNPSRWREAYLCRTSDEGKTTSKEAILRCAHERNDAWGREVAFRANLAVSDLHAADARYHRDCIAKFFTNRPSAGGSSTEACDSALDDLLTQMSLDFTRIWNSVELHSLYSELGGTLLSRRSLVKSVHEHFHSRLLVLSSPGVASILVFRGKASDHLRIVEDAEDDCDAAISKVAKRIKEECQQLKTDGNTYATRISMNTALAECSNSLLSLLSEISPKLDSTMQAAMIGSIVMSVVNSRATCLQISLGVLLNQKRKLVDQFHNFGVTSSYNELRRFKISCASAMANSPRLGLFDSKKGLIQVVADNFDTEISSQNGQKSTHGLAMIITQAGQPKPGSASDIPEIPTIKRLKWNQTKASSLTLGEVNVQRYHGSKKPEMPAQYGMKVVPTLVFLASREISLDRAAFEDLSFLREVTGDTPSPEYNGFNTKCARENGQQPGHKTGIVYTPFLDMIPAEPDTMKTGMVEAQRLTLLTGQEWTVFTNDQQLYQVAVNITWVDRDMFAMFVPRLGGMHMMMSFVGAVGTLMRGSGLEEILKSTFAGVPKLLCGKKFPQNVRALRIVTEELLRPLLDDHQELHSTKELTEYLALESQKSNTTKLWVDCLIKPVLIMMKFVRAEREGDWPLHLSAVEEMLPYFFASSHVNYARYGLYYLRSMQRLHPTLLNKFMAGQHVMRHQDGFWNGIWSDLFIETTYMRYGHGPAGIVGFTLNESTLAIWALSHSTCVQLMNDLEAMKDGPEQHVVTSHKEERPTRIKADAADRMKIREVVSTCIDVFESDKHPDVGLVDIFSGRVIDDAAVNVHNSLQIGTNQWLEYERQWPAGFHKKLTKKVKTMAAATKATTKLGKEMHILDTEFVYARVIGLMASSREIVSVETLFSHELASHPTALFDDSGEMRKTSKSVLKNKLQVMCGMRNRQLPEVVILDACALLWTIPWPASPAKVSAFINAAVARMLERVETTSILHVVFDRYYNLSIKSGCRTTRQKGLSRVYKLTEESPLPKQAIVLNVSANKKQVIQMIVDQLCSVQVPTGKRVVITGPEPHPVQVGVGKWQTPITHEEADVIMAYHMIQEAAAGHSPIRVVCDDTDVLLILVHHLHAHLDSLPESVQVTMEGCSGYHAIIDVNEVVQQHAAVIPNLLGAHALSGCDTMSSFFGIGKAKVLKRLMKFTDSLCLGDLSASLDEVTDACLRFIATLYGMEQGASLNSMRADLFKRKIAGKRHVPPKLRSLPPTMAAFRLHCQRAHFQTALWKAASMSSPPDLDPLQYGWEMKGQELQPVFTPPGQLAAPDEVLNIVSCGCKTGCKTALCSCVKFNLTCSEFCKCMGQANCQNPMKVVASDSDDSDDEEFDEEFDEVA